MNEVNKINWSRFFSATFFLFFSLILIAIPVLIFTLDLQNELRAVLLNTVNRLNCIAFYTNCTAYNIEFSNELMTILFIPVISAIVSLFINIFILKSYDARSLYDHIHGPVLLTEDDAFKDAVKKQKQESGSRGIYVHPKICISLNRELGNFFVFGQQGGGKSTVIKAILRQLFARDDSLFIYDEKREYTEQFLSDSVILVSPGDQRSFCWNIAEDITDELSAKSVARVLIKSSNQDKFWTDAAQVVLTGVFICLISEGKKWGWKDLKSLVFSEAKVLNEKFKKYFIEGLNLVEPESKTSMSILTTLSTQLSWLSDLADHWENCQASFSFADIKKERKSLRIIVAGNPMAYEMSASLCAALFSLLSNKIIASPDSSTRCFWFVLDELANLPKTESLKNALALGRSKGLRTIAGTQAVSQIRSIYGLDDAETMLSLFSNIIVLRTGPTGDSAKVASACLGIRKVEQTIKSFDANNRESSTKQRVEIPVVSSDEIIHLPRSNTKISGYLLINGYQAVYRLDWPIIKRKQIAKAFIPNVRNLVTPDIPVSPEQSSKNRFRRGWDAS